MRRDFDFAPLLRSSIGFENINRLIDIAARAAEGGENGYPPYNIEKLGDSGYRITMAVAGFTREELDITVQENSSHDVEVTRKDGQKNRINKGESQTIGIHSGNPIESIVEVEPEAKADEGEAAAKDQAAS